MNNIPKIVTKEIEKSIIKDYIDGMQWLDIYKKYHIDGRTLSEIIKSNKINYRTLKTFHNLNHNYFSRINDFSKAYWLGFLFADGHNCVEKGVIRLCVSERDSYILKDFQREINHTGGTYIYKNSEKNINQSDSYTIIINSKEMSRDLLKLGMTQRKSLTLKFPDIKRKFLKSFILGYFDGDGSIIWRNSRGGLECTVNFVGSHIFCKELAKILTDLFKIKCGINKYKDVNVSTVRFASIDSITKFYNLFYVDNKYKIYLSRKYNKFIEYLKEWNINI